LNAMEEATLRRRFDTHNLSKSIRQYRAFRARILKMDAEKDKRIARLRYYVQEWIEEKYE